MSVQTTEDALEEEGYRQFALHYLHSFYSEHKMASLTFLCITSASIIHA